MEYNIDLTHHEKRIKEAREKLTRFEQEYYDDVLLLCKLGFEIYKKIDEFDNYEVSTFGRVRNVKSGRVLKPSINVKGYHYVKLYKHDKGKKMKVHRLVAIAFIPNSSNKPCADHINNNPADNILTNVRWATHSENGMNASMNSRNTSGTKGVSFHKRQNKWYAQITVDGKRKHLGYFTNIDDAVKARQEKAKEIFGEFINKCEI